MYNDREEKKEKVEYSSFFENERLEDYAALSLSALILILILIIF